VFNLFAYFIILFVLTVASHSMDTFSAVEDYHIDVKTQREPVLCGAFSDVYRGFWNGMPVAVKLIRMGPGEQKYDKLARRLQHTGFKERRQMISREAKLWRSLSHPNVLPFLGLCCDLERPLAMVSPWMSQGNIVECLRISPNTNRIKLLSEIAIGLAYLHSVPVVHGDLKGSNVLINSSGEPCIADFGLARIIDKQSSFGGTTRWTAPELLHDGELLASPATDVYSFACVCYEVFTERLPFYNITSEFDVVIAIYNYEHPPRPPEIHPATSRGLDDSVWALMQECWNASPDERPTASTLCQVLAGMSMDSGSPVHTDISLDSWEDGRDTISSRL
jgi:serine/threonine protein kinase